MKSSNRDAEISDKMYDYGKDGKIQIDTIQVGVYTENQFGFRILKKDYELGQQKTILKSNEDSENIGNLGIPINPVNESYYGGVVLKVLFFFDPNIFIKVLHQAQGLIFI